MKSKKIPQKKVVKLSNFDQHIKQKQNQKSYKEQNNKIVKKQIQKEYKSEQKKGKFQDDRIIKTQMLNQNYEKKQKKNIFDLEDSDEGNKQYNFTHLGKEIDYKDDFLSDQSDLSDQEEYNKAVQDTHFGGFDQKEEINQKKSKEEIYKEIIKKSKIYRHEKQRLKELNEEEKDRVDEEYINIVSMLKFRKRGEKTLPLPNDDYNNLHNSLQDEKRLKANLKKENPNKKKRIRKVQFDTENCFSSQEESQINDDELDEKVKKRTKIDKIGHEQRKQVKLNEFVQKIKNQNNQQQFDDDFNDIPYSEDDESDNDEDDGEENVDENDDDEDFDEDDNEDDEDQEFQSNEEINYSEDN